MKKERSVDIHHLIAALVPEVYCEPGARRKVKRLLRERGDARDGTAYEAAAVIACPVEANLLALEELEEKSPYDLPGLASPIERHILGFSSLDESQEAFYFWLVDYLAQEGWALSKPTDSLSLAAGSGMYADLNRQGMQAQQQVLRMLRECHALVREILRAASSLKSNGRLGPEGTPERGEHEKAEMELLRWKVESLQLMAHWLGPYLRQARELQFQPGDTVDLVRLFNTASIQMVLLAEQPYSLREVVDRGDLPKGFLKGGNRTYSSVLVLEVNMRSAPEQSALGGVAHRGRREMTLTSYALNEEELATLRVVLERDSLAQTLDVVAKETAEAVQEIVRGLENPQQQTAQPIQASKDSDPFSALFAALRSFLGGGSSLEEAPGTYLGGLIREDNEFEQVIRSQVILEARRRCLDLYERSKGATQMVG